MGPCVGESEAAGMSVVGLCVIACVGEGVGVKLSVGEYGSTDVNANECLLGEDGTTNACMDECSLCGGEVGVSGAGVWTGGFWAV